MRVGEVLGTLLGFRMLQYNKRACQAVDSQDVTGLLYPWVRQMVVWAQDSLT